MNQEITYIYSLEFPKGNIRYVGKSNNPEERLKDHISESKNYTETHKTAWINRLLKSGNKPVLGILDEVPMENWEISEQMWIQLCKSWGFDLVNTTEGGDGIHNPNKEIRDKISKALKEKYASGYEPWNKGSEGLSLGYPKGKKRTEKDRIANQKRKQEYFKTHDVWNKGVKTGYTPWNKGKKGVMPTPWNKGKIMDEKIKQKVSESCKGVKKIKCEYCGKEMNPGNYYKYHGDRCKFKKILDIVVNLKG